MTDPTPSIDPKVEKKLLRKIDGYVISLLGVGVATIHNYYTETDYVGSVPDVLLGPSEHVRVPLYMAFDRLLTQQWCRQCCKPIHLARSGHEP